MKSFIRIFFIASLLVSGFVCAADNNKGDLVACVNDDNPPFSSLVKKEADVDIQVLRLISQKMGRQLRIHWVQIPNRGGLGKALRTSISEGLCDAFIGLPTDSAFLEELREKKLTISKPYLKVGYFLVSREPVDVKMPFGSSVKIGTVTRTSGDFFIHRQYPQNRQPVNSYEELIEALNKKVIDYGLIWSPAIAIYQNKLLEGKYRLTDFEPENLTMNMSFGVAVKTSNMVLMANINAAIDELLKDGSLKAIANQSTLPFVKVPGI